MKKKWQKIIYKKYNEKQTKKKIKERHKRKITNKRPWYTLLENNTSNKQFPENILSKNKIMDFFKVMAVNNCNKLNFHDLS